jgi:hypothetical protein
MIELTKHDWELMKETMTARAKDAKVNLAISELGVLKAEMEIKILEQDAEKSE